RRVLFRSDVTEFANERQGNPGDAIENEPRTFRSLFLGRRVQGFSQRVPSAGANCQRESQGGNDASRPHHDVPPAVTARLLKRTARRSSARTLIIVAIFASARGRRLT